MKLKMSHYIYNENCLFQSGELFHGLSSEIDKISCLSKGEYTLNRLAIYQ